MQVGIVLPLGKAVTLAKALETAILDLHSATTAIPAVQSTNGTIPNKMTVIREDCVRIDITPPQLHWCHRFNIFFGSIGGLLGRLTGGGRPGNHVDSRFGHEGRYEGRFGGGGGGYMAGGGYPGQQQQPQVVYVEQQQAPKKGSGMGKLALAGSQVFLGPTAQFYSKFFSVLGGAGLLGGVLLGEALERRDDDFYRDDDYRDDNCGYGDLKHYFYYSSVLLMSFFTDDGGYGGDNFDGGGGDFFQIFTSCCDTAST